MSYLVLARKWRPRSFDDIVGQEHVTRTLKNAISSERVAHAYLFTGARGVGKTSAARILAKALNCESGPTTEPCNQCGPCKEISGGSAVDVHEIDGASNTGVDDVRELKESVNYLPSLCRKKVYIIDEVHMLSTSAFNALLKTLEEPPPHVIFIFATTEPHKIPGTILSRCQRFDFKRIPIKIIFDRLNRIVSEEGVEISEKSLMVIAREADGGMRDAQSLLDQVISFSGRKVSDEDVIDVLGVIDMALVQEAASAIIEKDCRKALQVVERLFNFGWDVKEFGKALLGYFRNLAVVRVAPGDKTLIESTDDEVDVMKKVSENVAVENLYLYFDVMARGLDNVVRSLHPKISFEMLLLKMTTLESLVAIEELINLSRNGGGQGDPLPDRPVSPPSPERNKAPQEVPEEKLPRARSVEEAYVSSPAKGPSGKDWKGFVAFVKTKKAVLGPILEHSHLISMDEKTIVLAPENDFSREKVKDESEVLKAFCKEYFGEERAVDVRALEKSVEKINSIHEEQKKKESDLSRKLKKEAAEHPVVLESLEVFKGKIEEIKTEKNINE
ncbi:MAG: DNA polymerase III subunit gamma/tau [Deltaproteobacteria bacterium]|nr:DNA polymerase III subunit gamma/tau [Deltaproteobacteria bacterium]